MTKPKNERGQSLVELSVSLLVLLFLLSGAVEFGLAFFQFVQLRDAAQEGALYGSMSPDILANIEARVRGASNSPVNMDIGASNPVTVNIYVDDVLVQTNGSPTGAVVSACEGHALKVEAIFNHVVFMPFMSQIIGPTVPLNATVTDTILSPVCSPSP